MTTNPILLEQQRVELQKWAKYYGLTSLMRNTAHHLLPDIPFRFKLNFGGGSYTDGHEVVVGVPELVFPMEKDIVLSVTKALTGHETEHVWSSDFKVFKQFQEDVIKYFKDEYDFAIASRLGAHMLNSTEDGRIEKRLINRYRGYKKHIQLLNATFWKAQPVKGENEMMEFLYCITSMCVTGLKSREWEVYYGGTEQDLLLDEIRPLIVRAINNPTAQGCADNTMDIVRVIAPYMLTQLEDLKNQQELNKLDDKASYSSSSPKEDADSQPGTSQSSHFLPEEEPEKQSSEGDGEENGEASDEENDDEKKNSKSKSKKKDESDEESEESGDGEGEVDKEDDEDEKGQGSSKSDEDKDGDSLNGDVESDTDEEPGKKDGEDDNSDSDGDSEDGKDDSDNKDSDDKFEKQDKKVYDDDQDNTATDKQNSTRLSSEEVEALIESALKEIEESISEEVENLLEEGRNEVLHQEAIDKRENEFLGHLSEEDMKKLDKNILYRNIDPKEKRHQQMPEHVKVNGRYLNKELEKILINKQTYTSRNRRTGILDVGSLYKMGVKDYNMFMKKGVPNDTSIAINVLVDYSGSMDEYVRTADATKKDLAIQAVAMIEEGLRDLVPHRISFFTAGYGEVMHSTVKDFNQQSKDNLSWKRVPGIPSWANQDGYSIKVGTLEILKRPERRKILIVLSDGLPTEPSSVRGQKEVKEAVRQARQDGVIVIAIAFGSEQSMRKNEEVYREMYQKGIIMVQPDQIHKELAKFIKNEISR